MSSLSGTGGTVALGAAALTINQATDTSYAGAVTGTGSLTKTGTGTLTLSGANTYTGATTVDGGTLAVSGSIASSSITNNSGLLFEGTSTAGSASIANNGLLQFLNTSTAGSATITITNTNTLAFENGSTAGSATITANSGGASFIENSASGGTARFILNGTGSLDISGLTTGGTTAGSIEGAGSVFLGSNNLAVGGNNLSTTFSGVIHDGGLLGGTGGSLTKTGTGTLTLSGVNTYTGATTVNAGVLEVDGSIASSSSVTVNTGGTLSGTGIVDPAVTTIMSGATLAPGSTANPTGTLTISGNLAFQSGALYVVQVTPSSAASTTVSGSATLTGASVQTVFAPGSYVMTKSYDILHATGGLGGTTFSGVSGNLAGFSESLSYTGTDVFLNLTGALGSTGGLNQNQLNVANVINNFFNGGGALPPGFVTLFGLTGNNLSSALTQASGETATGSQQTTFDAMNQFMGVLTDPFIDGRGDGVSAGSSPGASAYASQDQPRSGAARDANAMFTKAPQPVPFVPSWSVWAAGYGGSQTTDGNAALGSNSATSRIAGTAVGADYRFSPFTLAGFALAGGGTNFSVNGLGGGRSDLFQAGAFIRHTVGPAYISGALAYGWQDITTDRTVTIAGVDRLRAEFNANAYSGRVEGGYRFVTPWIGGIGLTPYAAGQFTTFDLPAYAEQVLSGANTFALAYGSKSVTDTRSELGLRTDKSFALQDAILTLRGRFAWAHDFNPDRSIGATFQTLPGASFVVNGAAQASDSALTTASVELKWRNGWSTAATFEGEFSEVTRSYAGKGVVRYSW